jgi:hypothetical protein
MKHILAIILIMLVAGAMAEGVNPGLGWYDPNFGLWWAVNEDICIHEIGHRLDQEGGWISDTNAWFWGVKNYKVSQLGIRSTFNDWLFTYPFELKELYADILQYCHGHAECVPDELKQFYDFGRGFTLIQERCMDYGKRKD